MKIIGTEDLWIFFKMAKQFYTCCVGFRIAVIWKIVWPFELHAK